MGSPNGIWTSVSGAMAQSQNLDIIANNLANVGSTAFKKDTPTFKEYLTAIERPPSPAIDIPRTIFKDSDFYHFDGREHAMVNVDKVHTDHSQGTLKLTNAPLDFAIDGSGYFAIQTPDGLKFSRAGSFKMSSDGNLVTTDGYPVLSLNGEALAQRNAEIEIQASGEDPAVAAALAPDAPPKKNPFTTPNLLKPINLREAIETGSRVTVTPMGQIFVGENQVGTIAVAEFVDNRMLKKVGSAFFENPNPANVPRISTKATVQQGYLEQSNVNPVAELVELLKANRLFESNMKAIRAYSEMSQKEANEVGKL
ncbi:MAG: flagellar hook-basal body protein [Bacteriovoracia bacterium]